MPSAPLTGATCSIGSLLAAVNAQIVIASLDAPSREDAAAMTAAMVVLVIAVDIGAAIIGWFAAGGMGGVPMACGGWGCRRRPGVQAFMIRRGQAFRFERVDPPVVLVTVDEAPVGAETIASVVKR